MTPPSRPLHVTPFGVARNIRAGGVVGSGVLSGRPLVALGVVVSVAWGWRRWRGRCALDQWPTPYGPHYDEWLAIKDPEASKAAGSYYPWLAPKMGGADPWRGSAEREL